MSATIVLLHGIGGNAAGFAPLLQAFARQQQPALAWNQPGYGDEPLVEPYDFDTCAQALSDWLTRTRPGAVVLAGHSMGGMLAQTLWRQQAARKPHDAGGDGWTIAGLVLAHTSPAFGQPDGDFQRRFVESRTRPLDEGKTMADMAKRLAPTLVAPGTATAVIEAAIAMMAVVPAATYRLAISALTRFDERAALPGISVPTLCLAAEHDRAAPPAVLERMATRIAGADYECLPGLGHLAPIEDPDSWSRTVAAWCARRLPR